MSETLPNFRSFDYDGCTALSHILKSSDYRTVEQAVASLAVFAHPETVRQTAGSHIFRVIRCKNNGERGKYREVEGNQVMLDDNKSPTEAFIWAHGITPGMYKDVQFNHLWTSSGDVRLYSSLTNICMLPAFLSKLSDTHEEVCSLLRFRAAQLFGDFLVEVQLGVSRPSKYEELNWAEPLPPVEDLEYVYRASMQSKSRNRTTRCARDLGWLFSDFRPDPSIGAEFE